MAWKEKCQIEVCTQIEHKVEKSGLSAKEAIRVLSNESGIPAKTIEHWYYMNPQGKPDGAKPEQPENSGRDKKKKAPMTQRALWASVDRRLSKIYLDIRAKAQVPTEIDRQTRENIEITIDALSRLLKHIMNETDKQGGVHESR